MFIRPERLRFLLSTMVLFAALPNCVEAICCWNGNITAPACCITRLEETCTQAGLIPTQLEVCTAAGPPACAVTAAGQCQAKGLAGPALSVWGLTTLVLALLTIGTIFIIRWRGHGLGDDRTSG